jgi:2'-5' RNA ligase
MMLRSFIAIELPPEIQKEIAGRTSVLQEKLPKPLVRWVPVQNIHLTLQFMGDVSPSNLELLSGELRIDVANSPCFEVLVGKAGAFPSVRRARTLWVGLTAPLALTTLQHTIQTTTARLGYQVEERTFSPHLTIGRVNQNASFADFQKIQLTIQHADVGDLGKFWVEAVHLYKSDLHPTGPVYTRIYSMPLARI